jgi:K(+)-stimulated pyrophosphate-energized sodium pump
VTAILAAEGGYQAFDLSAGDIGWLWFAMVVAVAALVFAGVLARGVLRADTGTPAMRAVAKSIQEGASAYLRRQLRTVAVIVAPLAVLVFLTATAVVRPDGTTVLSMPQSGAARTVAFLAGCALSALTGYLGMSLAVRGNVRTAAAARGGSLRDALSVAFRTGGVAGMLTVGLGLLGATAIVLLFQQTSSAILIGFGFGGSLLALFMRVGGGIFTKAADVGADLVGKVEAGIPEDDPRNPATIADNVGDNVGDCAGMAADLFESYEVTLVASIILGVAAFGSIGANPALGLVFPIIVRALGVLASIAGVLTVRARAGDRSAQTPINRGFAVAGALTVVGTLAVAIFYLGNSHGGEGWRSFAAVAAGLLLAQVVGRLTEHFTSTRRRPVREIAEAARTGPATTVLSGISVGLEASVWAIVAIAGAIVTAIMLGGGNLQLSLYLVALTGMGMLATTGVVVSEDTYGPVADNAAGIAEMTGEFHGDAERVMTDLDAVGNTTKAVTKGFAIGSAVIAAVALFASFIQTIADELEVTATGSALYTDPGTQINIADPRTFVGLLIGGAMALLFSALAIRAVSRTAGVVVDEVRRQFRERRILEGIDPPDHGAVIDICTHASIRELATPALLAVLMPAVVGFGLGVYALGAFLGAVILTGQLFANFLSVSGGAWDNAKKYIEAGNLGGKGSPAHTAAVIGDTIGDPFKDTAGPALNPLIKVMNLVSLLLLPAVIGLADNPIRFAIAAAAQSIVIGAIAFSKRTTQHHAAAATDTQSRATVGAP